MFLQGNTVAFSWNFLKFPLDWFDRVTRGFTMNFLEQSPAKQMCFLAAPGLSVEIPVGLCPGLLQYC